MNAQQLHDLIIKPTLQYMGGRYYSKDAAMLLLATAAIESDCGYYIKQINGPALGIWQMEPDTHQDIITNCDAIKNSALTDKISRLLPSVSGEGLNSALIDNPRYSCVMARLKYSMDSASLPDYTDVDAMYNYYKRVYNTHLGASTKAKFMAAWNKHNLSEVEL